MNAYKMYNLEKNDRNSRATTSDGSKDKKATDLAQEMIDDDEKGAVDRSGQSAGDGAEDDDGLRPERVEKHSVAEQSSKA